jgi:GNAT superfamily N-acetyltransferase
MTDIRADASEVIIRRLSPADSLEEVTELLHAAYRALAEAGLHYVASHQAPEVTALRVASGECCVAALHGRLVGTINLVPPGRSALGGFYARPGVSKVGQFGVRPELQRQGIGGRLLRHAEERAKELGATTMALDTAEQATELIAMYQRRGYRIVDQVDYRPRVNYRSVVMARTLT